MEKKFKNEYEGRTISPEAEDFIHEAFRTTDGLYGHALNHWSTNVTLLNFGNWRDRIKKIPLYQEIIEKQHNLPAERELAMRLSNKDKINEYNALVQDFNTKLPDILKSKDEDATSIISDYFERAKELIGRTAE